MPLFKAQNDYDMRYELDHDPTRDEILEKSL
jgi:hypothetical protein